MASRRYRGVLLIVLTLCVLTASAVAAPLAAAQSYADVPSGHWARSAIDWVTDQGPTGNKVLDDYDTTFKPEQAITRAQLARALVIASGHEGETVNRVTIPDMPPKQHPYYWDVQIALRYGFMGFITQRGVKGFHPDSVCTASKAEVAVVRWLKRTYASADWSMLGKLKSGTWEPTAGWKPSVPSYFQYVVASRQLLLRFNHPTDDDAHEVRPNQAIDRAEVAYMIRRALAASGSLWGIPKYADVILPALSERQEQVLAYAFKFLGYPYIWGGEWPTENSPYGYQAAGGFDCSGFTFYVMQCHFGYPVTGRGAGDQAKLAEPRIARSGLRPGDLMFFGYSGTKSTAGEIYHAALYMGNGWFIHSTGSSDGVTIASLNDPCNTYWKTYFAWGRRLLRPAELVIN
jgi:cell wall-associated NlpC family hydrolase